MRTHTSRGAGAAYHFQLLETDPRIRVGRLASSLEALSLSPLLLTPTFARCLGIGSSPTSMPRVFPNPRASGRYPDDSSSTGIAPGSRPALQVAHQLCPHVACLQGTQREFTSCLSSPTHRWGLRPPSPWPVLEAPGVETTFGIPSHRVSERANPFRLSHSY